MVMAQLPGTGPRGVHFRIINCRRVVTLRLRELPVAQVAHLITTTLFLDNELAGWQSFEIHVLEGLI